MFGIGLFLRLRWPSRADLPHGSRTAEDPVAVQRERTGEPHRLDGNRRAGASGRGEISVRPRRSEALGKEVPGWVTGALVLGTLAAILWLERRRPLRPAREDKLRRDARNLAMGAM